MYQDAQSIKHKKKKRTADISCHLFENWSHYQPQFVNVQSQYRDVMQEAGRILMLVLCFVKQK